MPAGLGEGILDHENVDGMIDKCVEKLKNILGRLRYYLVEQDLKEFQDVIEYQLKIKEHVQLVLDQNSQGNKGCGIVKITCFIAM
jgi:hypothetical protein